MNHQLFTRATTARLFSWALICASLSCGGPAVPSKAVEPAAAAKAHDEMKPVTLNSETIKSLLLYDRRLVAAVRCDEARFEHKGTRSERVQLSTTVVAAEGLQAGTSISLSRFTQGDPLLRPGQVYLVAGYDDGSLSPAFTLVEWLPIAPGDARTAVTTALQLIQQHATHR